MIDVINLNFLTAFSIGFLGSLHCVGMCGGISGALATAIPPPTTHQSNVFNLLRKLNFQLFYSGGRLGSYMIAGAIAGSIGATVSQISDAHGISVLRILSGVMIILLGFYISGWWMALSKLERAGTIVWKQIRPLTKPLMPVNNVFKAGLLGALWGWLPCGLVYSGLTWSMAAGNTLDSALLMLFFGIGTLPAMIGVGFFSGMLADFARSRATRSIAGVIMILYGSWTIWGNISMALGHSNHDGMNHQEMNHNNIDHSLMDHSK